MFISQNRKGTVPDRFIIFIVGHIKEHYTIEELAERFEISPTDNETLF